MTFQKGELVMVKERNGYGYSWALTKFVGRAGIVTMTLLDIDERKPDSQIMVYFPDGKEFFFFEEELVRLR